MQSIRHAFLKRWLRTIRPKDAPRVVFLHIPKCAGSSVNLHFKANCKHSVLLNSLDNPDITTTHKADYIAGHMGWQHVEQIQEHSDKPLFYFTYLRDPLERLWSLYHYCKSLPKAQNHAKFPIKQAQSLDFVPFCLHESTQVFTQNVQTRTLFKDYTYFPNDSDEQILDTAINHAKLLDFIGKTKQLNTDLPLLAKHTQTKLLQQIIRKNPSQHNTIEEREALTKQLELILSLDIQLYNHF